MSPSLDTLLRSGRVQRLLRQQFQQLHRRSGHRQRPAPGRIHGLRHHDHVAVRNPSAGDAGRGCLRRSLFPAHGRRSAGHVACRWSAGRDPPLESNGKAPLTAISRRCSWTESATTSPTASSPNCILARGNHTILVRSVDDCGRISYGPSDLSAPLDHQSNAVPLEASLAGAEPVRAAGRRPAPVLCQAAPDVAGAAEGGEVRGPLTAVRLGDALRPVSWIPASAGMTERVWCSSLPGVRQCPRIAGRLCSARATHRGVQRGTAPLRSSLSPESGGSGG